MKKQNLRSEAAILRVIRGFRRDHLEVYLEESGFAKLIVIDKVKQSQTGDMYAERVAEIDLRELVKKRQPLTGIKKQVAAIVSGKKKVKK